MSTNLQGNPHQNELYIKPAEQAQELSRRLSEARQREERYRRVAETLRAYLETLDSKPPDLHRLGGLHTPGFGLNCYGYLTAN